MEINKQRFLTDLGKLVTFMYEDDRKLTLGMYEALFDECDEQTLLLHLVSPTRQAVLLARAYDAKARKAQQENQNPGEEPENDSVNQFLDVVRSARESYFRDYGAGPGMPEVETIPAAASEPMQTAAEKPAESTAEKPLEESFPAETETAGQIGSVLPEENPEAAPAEPAEEENPGGTGTGVGVADRSELTETGPETGEAGTETAEIGMETAEAGPEAVDSQEDLRLSVPAEDAMDLGESKEPMGEAPAPRKKTNIPLLLLYILLAIPVTLVGFAALLLPTALFLVLAAAASALGVVGISFALGGGLNIVADMLIVLGITLVLLALGLLFLWTSIWLIGGAEVGLFRGIIRLGGKLCCKEVAAA